MNDIFNEVFTGRDTSRLTPIEIALGIDNEGRTTATKLYDFLELNPSNYSKWFRKNILENEFAEETVDYFPFVLRYESLTGEKERQDAKLTAHFAKKLSMVQKNQKGDAARNYFVGIEDGAKKLIGHSSGRLDAAVFKGLSSLGNLIRNTMKDEKAKPYETAEVLDSLFRQGGLVLPKQFIQIPEYEQMSLDNFMK